MESTSQSKPRGRRLKHHKSLGHKTEVDAGETAGSGFGSPGVSPTDSTGSEQEKQQRFEDPLAGRWESRQTPPLEQSPQLPAKFMTENKDLSILDQYSIDREHIERRSKKPRRRKGGEEETENPDEIGRKESGTEHRTTHLETGQEAREFETSFGKEEECTKCSDPVYTPIHLPLSCEIYTPAYCVQATDRFDRLANGEEYKNSLRQHDRNTPEGKSPELNRIDLITGATMKEKGTDEKIEIDLAGKFIPAGSERPQRSLEQQNIRKRNEAESTKQKAAKNGVDIDIECKTTREKFGSGLGKKAKTRGKEVDASSPGVEISGPKLHAPDVNVGMDVGGLGDVGADVSLPKADVSVKAPKFGFKFGKKGKTPKVEGPSLGGSATGTGGADLGVSVKGEAPGGGLKLKLPKFGWPKGSLKLGGDADVSGKVKVPEAGVHVSGPEVGGKIELPQAPGVDASVSLPGLDAGVSGGVRPDLSGDISLTGGVDMPSAEVSVPSKKFHFGFGGKAKGEKKVKKPKVSGKADLGLDVGGDVRVPDLDVHAGGKAKGRGWKFGWSPKISLPKVKLGHGDLSADAGVKLPEATVDVSGPSIKLPSVRADVDVPRVDVQFPDVSTVGDLGGAIDVSAAVPSVSVGGDVKVPDLSVSGELPSLDVGGGVDLSGTPGSLGVDLSMPRLDVDASLPGVEISGPKLHAPDVNVGMDVGGLGDVGADVSLPKADVSVKVPSFGMDIGKGVELPKVDIDASLPGVEISGPKLHAPDVNVGMDVGGLGDVGADVSLPKADVSVKAPKFGFKFGKKGKTPKVEGPSLGGSATGTGGADLGVSVKGEAPGGGLKLKLPKFGWPKGSLKLGGDADVSGKVKVPEAGVHVSGPEVGGKIELPQAPGVDASVSLPGLDAGVSGGVRPDLSGDISLTGGVDMPSAEVSVPSKKFHFGFGGKAKGEKKVKKPKVSGKADLGLDVGGDVRVPDLDVHAGGKAKGRGWKFGWSPKISLPKVKLGHGDLSADAGVKLPEATVDVSGPSIKLPSVRADVDVPRVDVQFPDVSTVGDLGGAIDVSAAVPSVSVGGDVKVPDLSVSGELPSLDVGGGVDLSGTPGSLGVDLSMPRLDVDASLPGVEISGPKLHAPDVNVGMGGVGFGDFSSCVDHSGLAFRMESPPCVLDFGKSSRLEFDSAPSSSLDADLAFGGPFFSESSFSEISSLYCANSFSAPIVVDFLMRGSGLPTVPEPVQLTSFPEISSGSGFGSHLDSAVAAVDFGAVPFGIDSEAAGKSGRHFWSLRFPSLRRPKVFSKTVDTDVDSGIGVAETAGTTRTVSTENLCTRVGSPIDDDLGAHLRSAHAQAQMEIKVRPESRSTLPRWFRPGKGKLPKSQDKSDRFDSASFRKESDCRHSVMKQKKVKQQQSAKPSSGMTVKSEKPKKQRKSKQPFGKKNPKSKQIDHSSQASIDGSAEEKPIPRIPSAKSKDLFSRQTWHGADDKMCQREEPSEPPTLPPSPSGINIQPILYDEFATVDVRRRGTSESTKRRPWSTLELPPPGCVFVNDDYLFPDALTPTKIPSFRSSKDVVYNVPYMDDKALPPEEPEWPIGESRRTLLSQRSDSIIRIAAEEESSIISLDDANGQLTETKFKSKRATNSSKKEAKKRRKEKDRDAQKIKEPKGNRPRSKSSNRFTALFSKSSRHSES